MLLIYISTDLMTKMDDISKDRSYCLNITKTSYQLQMQCLYYATKLTYFRTENAEENFGNYSMQHFQAKLFT